MPPRIRLSLIVYGQVAEQSVCARRPPPLKRPPRALPSPAAPPLTSMQCLEGDWIDGALASRPCSTTGCPILWQVYINEHHKAECWADFVPADNAKIEHAFTTGKTPCSLASVQTHGRLTLTR